MKGEWTEGLDQLIEFSLRTDLADIPDEIAAESALSFANTAGVALAALGSETVRAATAAVVDLGGHGQAHIFGTSVTVPVDRVAFVNAIAAHLLDFDDTHLATIYHPTPTLFGGLLPVAERNDLTGGEFLAAWTIGVEAGTRIAMALGREHYDAGWHVTATAGAVAAAIVAGRAMGLDAAEMRHCVGIASARASGHRAQFGSMMKPGQVGFAASAGVEAAQLAQHGFTSAPDEFAGPRGFMQVIAPEPDVSRLTVGLGSTWLVADNRIKPYASGVVTHPVIDLGREVAESELEAAAIDEVQLLVHPLVAELTGKLSPQTGLEGKFSATHCFAAGVLLGSGGPRAFTDELVRRPDITNLRDKCQLVVEPDREHMTAAALVRSGEVVHEFEVLDSRGGNRRPVTQDEVRDKFIDATTYLGLLTAGTASTWFERLRAVGTEPSIAALAVDASTIH